MANRRYNLKEFRTGLSSVARNQYFYIDLGSTIQAPGGSLATSALARSTTLPAVTHGVLDVPYRGLNIRITDKPEFPEWTVTYLCTEDHELRHAHIAWMKKAYDVTGQENKIHSNYKVDDVQLYHLNSAHQDIYGYKFFGMFPSAVGDMTVAQEGGEVMQFDVTYSYDYFLTAKGEGVRDLSGVLGDDIKGIIAKTGLGGIVDSFKGLFKNIEDLF
jgi:hypothetical protein